MRTPNQQVKMYKYPHEVFEQASKISSFHDRVKFMQEYQSFSIKTILQLNFIPSLNLELPPGCPPYKADEMPAGYSITSIDKAIKILGRLVQGPTPSVGLSRIQKETMFIRLLESVCEKDAAIIVAAKDKDLEKMYPGIDLTLVKASFPALF